MPRIRILIVDDSAVIRKVLTEALASDPSIEVAGTAADGRIALAKIAQLNPDLVTLDVEMPNLSGLETIIEIRKLRPKLPIIMFSTLTERGATTTLDALALGASDYVAKPSNTGSLEATMAKIKQDLLPKIKALCGLRQRIGKIPEMPRSERKTTPATAPPRRRVPIEILAIGTSTGGPNALSQLIPAIPGDFPVPIVIVQHMPPVFTRMLAERLNNRSAITVHEGEPGKKLEPGQAWIAPGDYHMTVERRAMAVQLATNQAPAENSCRPAVDVLFRSVARAYGAHVLAVVMTGMGADGLLGAHRIREAGGEVIIQDEASSVIWGMPGAVSSDGQADAVYPLEQLGPEITRRANRFRSLGLSKVLAGQKLKVE
jgi:two-component system, chemotaxis family, protein-glutamate methylesterase/glutaminase